jgi:hypothetical protein
MAFYSMHEGARLASDRTAAEASGRLIDENSCVAIHQFSWSHVPSRSLRPQPAPNQTDLVPLEGHAVREPPRW